MLLDLHVLAEAGVDPVRLSRLPLLLLHCCRNAANSARRTANGVFGWVFFIAFIAFGFFLVPCFTGSARASCILATPSPCCCAMARREVCEGLATTAQLLRFHEPKEECTIRGLKKMHAGHDRRVIKMAPEHLLCECGRVIQS